MGERKSTRFYRPHLAATRQRRANPLVVVRQWLRQLHQCYLAWEKRKRQEVLSSPGETLAPTRLPLSPRAYYRFLVCLGALRRTRLMKYQQGWNPPEKEKPQRISEADSPVRQFHTEPAPGIGEKPSALRSRWYALASEYAPVLRWAQRIYREFGLALVVAGLEVFDPQGWLQRAEKLAEQTEFADAPALSEAEQRQLARSVRRLWAELDAADLFVALANQVLFFSSESDWKHVKTAVKLPFPPAELTRRLEALQSRLVKCHEWLEDHPEPFFLIDAYLQAVAAGFSGALRHECDLYLTADKYAAMLDALEVAEGVTPRFRKASSWLLSQIMPSQEVLPMLQEISRILNRASAQPRSSHEDAGQWCYYRAELQEPLLAAASEVEAPPRLLCWEAPDGRYIATLLISGRDDLVLRFFTQSGSEAAFLEGEPVYLGGVSGIVGPGALTRIPLRKLLESSEDLYLEVGQDRTRWRPLRSRTPN